MCSARLFAMLSSVLVEGFCTALTLLTRRHDILIRFGPLLLLLISTGSLEVFFVNRSRFQSSWTIGTGSSIISSLVSGIVASGSPSRCLFTSKSLSSSIDRSGLVISSLTLSSTMPSICSFCAAQLGPGPLPIDLCQSHQTAAQMQAALSKARPETTLDPEQTKAVFEILEKIPGASHGRGTRKSS